MTHNIIPPGMLGHLVMGPSLSESRMAQILINRGVKHQSPAIKFLDYSAFDWDNVLLEEGTEHYFSDFVVHVLIDKHNPVAPFGFISSQLKAALNNLFFGTTPRITGTSVAEWDIFTSFIANTFPAQMVAFYEHRLGGRYRPGQTKFDKDELKDYIADWNPNNPCRFKKVVGVLGQSTHGVYYKCEPVTFLRPSSRGARYIIEDYDTLYSRDHEVQMHLMAKYCFMVAMCLPQYSMIPIEKDHLSIPLQYVNDWTGGTLFEFDVKGCAWADKTTICQTGENCVLLSLYQLIHDNYPMSNPMTVVPQWGPAELEVLVGLILQHFVLTGELPANQNELFRKGTNLWNIEYYRTALQNSITRITCPTSKIWNNGYQLLKELALKVLFRYHQAMILISDPSKTVLENGEEMFIRSVERMRNGLLLRPLGGSTNSIKEDIALVLNAVTRTAWRHLLQLWNSVPHATTNANCFGLFLEPTYDMASELFGQTIISKPVEGINLMTFLHTNRIVGLITVNSLQPMSQNRMNAASHILIYVNTPVINQMVNSAEAHIKNIRGSGAITYVGLRLPQPWASKNQDDPLRVQFENCVMYASRFAMKTVSLTLDNAVCLNEDRIKGLSGCVEGIGEIAVYTLISTVMNS